MDSKCFYEDEIISRRMKLFGDIIKLDSADVLYRASSQSLTNYQGMTLSKQQKLDFQQGMIKQKIFTLHCSLSDTYRYEFNANGEIRFMNKLRKEIRNEITFQYMKLLSLQNSLGKVFALFKFDMVFIQKLFKLIHFVKKYK